MSEKASWKNTRVGSNQNKQRGATKAEAQRQEKPQCILGPEMVSMTRVREGVVEEGVGEVG